MPKYPLKLKDEVRVTRENINKLFYKKKVFVVGYGSLLFEHGWRRRKMKITTRSKDLKECVVQGYERGPFGMHTGIHFYGAIPNKSQNFNAVLNRIHTAYDWEGLMETEAIAGMFRNYNYRVVDVTALISGVKLPKNAVVHMVANELTNKRLVRTCRPAPGYYEYVWKGVVKEHTSEFIKKFLKTGGYDYKGARSLDITYRTMKYF